MFLIKVAFFGEKNLDLSVMFTVYPIVRFSRLNFVCLITLRLSLRLYHNQTSVRSLLDALLSIHLVIKIYNC